ncbi:MAG: 3'(2'),5'-bisphosphate nucleotidase [Candidatus Omnitrophica bacterium]|nr:3'(2'),5'-bisphosphate nucleotidase [Candidatus Omnitrophota bacterium]
MRYEKELSVAVEAVIAAARLCTYVAKTIVDTEVITKGDKSPVTVADYGSQAIVAHLVSGAFPDDLIVAEEHSLELAAAGRGGVAGRLEKAVHDTFDPAASLADIVRWIDPKEQGGGTGRAWVLDPIDGTKGFIRGGQYAIALALLVDNAVQLGVLGCPNMPFDGRRTGSVFVARRGQGAYQCFLGDQKVQHPIHVSSDFNGGDLRFVESAEAEHTDHEFHRRLCRALKVTRDPLRTESQGKYGVVARGEASAYLRMPSVSDRKYKQKIWDHAAGSVILEEAGGKVSDIRGNKLDFSCGITLRNNTGIVATNGICHNMIVGAIQDVISIA